MCPSVHLPAGSLRISFSLKLYFGKGKHPTTDLKMLISVSSEAEEFKPFIQVKSS